MKAALVYDNVNYKLTLPKLRGDFGNSCIRRSSSFILCIMELTIASIEILLLIAALVGMSMGNLFSS